MSCSSALKNHVSGVVALDEEVIERMIDYYPLAPAHNPAYVAAIQHMKE